MWFVTKSIFDYIVNTNLSKNKKADIIRDNQRKIRKEIKHLTPKEIVQYLFNSKIPNELKRMITEEVNELSTKNDDASKKKIDRLIIEFKKIKCNKEKFIKSGLCPDIFKKVIIDKVYGEDLVKAVTDNAVNREIRKEIIRLNIRESEDVVKLLSKELPKDFEDYILENCFNDEYDIRRVLDSVKVSERVKERIVREKVNIDNMFKIMYLAFPNTEKLIYEIKADEIKRYSDTLNYRNILDVINNYNTPRSFVEYLIEHKEEEICKAIDRAKLDVIATTVFKERDSKLIKIVLERKGKTLYKVINNLYDFQLLNWLNIKKLPMEYKNYIIAKHKRKLKMAINRLSAYDARNYLKVESVVPQEIQDLILERCKDKILEDAGKNGDADLISTIRYQSLSLPVRRLLIKEKINESNVFLLLGEKYLDNETLMLTLELKKDIIRECLKKYDAEELFKLKMKGITKENAGKILEDNQDLVREKVKLIDKDELMEYFDDDSVHKIVKKVMLEECFVNEDDVDNILSLIECYDTRLILDNYDHIKRFISNLGINFGAFLQYGSGSRKYSSWLDKIIEIMFEDMTDDFVRCKEYLFKNYYEVDDENSISAISCFLEYLDNFRRYRELFISMVDNDVKLSEDDKVNIAFLFSIKKSKRMVYPTKIEDVAGFKLKLYKEYVDCIEDKYASLDELQKIFNDVLFCEAKNILEYIGGTGALRTLKKDNINSPSVVRLVDELMVYSTMIELVNDTNNVEGLRNVLRYIFSDTNVLMKLQKIFSNFEKKVTRLYELDSNNNLTRISDAREIEGCLDIEKCLEYGGEVFNFSDKNYCLYGHILSRKEKIEDVIKGVATGDSNFISVSPISYRGQKYYWDRDNVIVAYDYVPNGKFICSSISNMGTNYIVRNNSSEVGNISRMQRGILETSAVVKQNAEALLYREGLKVCGLVLPGNRKPSKEEMEIHEKYGLPFIITQNVKEAIDNPKYVFVNDLEVETKVGDIKEVEEILKMLRPNVSIKKEDAIYTGKEIAVFADCHSMYEPTLAILEDIRRRGIIDIYSLGDNVGLGPNPVEVFDLLEDYGVKSIAGNAEYYNTLGVEPFPYLVDAKLENQLWTESKLGQLRISKLKAFPASVDLTVGNRKFALCHFANDVRWDFRDRSVHTYYRGHINSNSSQQFRVTNSDETLEKITRCAVSNQENISIVKGYVAAREEPLFGGKLVTDYDCILQGHVHFEIDDKLDNTDIFTLRAVSMGFVDKEETNKACYYVLRERKDGDVDIEKVYVPFNRNALVSSIHTCDLPSKERVLSYIKKSR